MTALPDLFMRRIAREELKQSLPPSGRFGAGLVFLPQDLGERQRCQTTIESLISEYGQELVGWRLVPLRPDLAKLGDSAKASEPHIEQIIIAASAELSDKEFERCLYIIRKRATHLLRGDAALNQREMFYICSLSSIVMIYKGMLRTSQLMSYFPDLSDTDYKSHLAMVHSRFSTNTFPSWDRAQPQRLMAHNGEINTLRGNINWMRAREGVMKSKVFGEGLQLSLIHI